MLPGDVRIVGVLRSKPTGSNRKGQYGKSIGGSGDAEVSVRVECKSTEDVGAILGAGDIVMIGGAFGLVIDHIGPF